MVQRQKGIASFFKVLQPSNEAQINAKKSQGGDVPQSSNQAEDAGLKVKSQKQEVKSPLKSKDMKSPNIIAGTSKLSIKSNKVSNGTTKKKASIALSDEQSGKITKKHKLKHNSAEKDVTDTSSGPNQTPQPPNSADIVDDMITENYTSTKMGPPKKMVINSESDDDAPGIKSQSTRASPTPKSPKQKSSPKKRTLQKQAAAIQSQETEQTSNDENVDNDKPTDSSAMEVDQVYANQPKQKANKGAKSSGSSVQTTLQFTKNQDSSKRNQKKQAQQETDKVEQDDAQADDDEAPSVRATLQKKANKVSSVEGVGLGAIESAKQYAKAQQPPDKPDKPPTSLPYTVLADAFKDVSEQSGQLVNIRRMVQAFRHILSVQPNDLLYAVYLCINRVAPAHESLELGMGEATVIKAMVEASGMSQQQIKALYEKTGDLGLVAQSARVQKTSVKDFFGAKKDAGSAGKGGGESTLTIQHIFLKLKEIATTEGKASSKKKQDMVCELLRKANGNESTWIVKHVQGKLRIGLAEQMVLKALAHATWLHQEYSGESASLLTRMARSDKHIATLAAELEQSTQALRDAHSVCPCYDVIVPALLRADDVQRLTQLVQFTPGVPIKAMLAKATNGVAEVIQKCDGSPFSVEYKYDGERAQIHVYKKELAGGGFSDEYTVQIFSRNSENSTPKFPDLVQVVPGYLVEGVHSVVLDGEVVAYDRDTDKILPFQQLIQRKRKDVKVEDVAVQVCFYVFDCLYLNGTTLLAHTLEQRREQLSKSVKCEQGKLQVATNKTSSDVDELQNFLDESVNAGTEGLIVKTLDSKYEPSKRSVNWLKLKKDYLEAGGDSYDLVPIGAWYGKGKRAGVYGSYLLAVYDTESEQYQTISKIGTGFSEEVLEQQYQSLCKHVIPQPKPYYSHPRDGIQPDVWLDTVVVWEVKGADISLSPKYRAAYGIVHPDKGISIRFPRLIRLRDDKTPEDATSSEQVAEMYKSQALIAGKYQNGNDSDSQS